MAKNSDKFRDDVTDEDGSGWLNRFLAEEDNLDKRATWQLASWGAGSVGLLIIAILATRSPAAIQREQLASNEFARQAQQVQWIARESQNKARELAAAVETLNADRDRLYARVTVIEQGLDSVTGSLNKPSSAPVAAATPPAQAATPAPEASPVAPQRPAEAKVEPAPLPKIAPVATITPAPQPPAKSEQKAAAPIPEPTVTSSITPPEATSESSSANLVRRTEFGVDLGGANSIEGLRAVWRGALKTNSQRLASMQPIIVVKERNDGLGMQLRLVAGPLANAAEAAKLCAGVQADTNRSCDTAVYEGQRLNMTSEKKIEAPVHRSRRRGKSRVESVVEEKPKRSALSSFFNSSNNN